MSCSTNPAGTPITFDIQYFMSNQCFSCTGNCPSYINSTCVYYAGPALSCSGVETNDSLETALQKIDEQICSAIGDYSNYQFNCLETWFGQEITQESQFVDAITEYVCELTETLEEFTGTTFPAFQTEVMTTISDTNSPGITCSSAGVTALDDLNTILAKYCTKFGQIDTALSISGVDWSECLSVVSTPTTIAEAFSLVVDQICQVKALTSGALPTFNNTGSCLASPGTADSLVSTIGKIKTRLCESPTWDASNVTWGCVTTPSDDSDIEEAIQNIVTASNTSLQALPTFDGSDFVVTATNPSDPCAGVTVSLATPIDQDRFVASNASDASPGTLIDKLTAGTNITLDDTTTPGQVIVNASFTDAYKVKADSSDPSGDYLDNKIEGQSGDSITLTTSYNSTTHKVDITPTLDISAAIQAIIDRFAGSVVSSDTLFASWCTMLAQCPCNCGADDCTSYSVTTSGPEPTEGYQVTYTDCVTGSSVTITLTSGATVTICARAGSVSGDSLSITAVESCAGGTTSTTTSTTTVPL